LGKVPIYSRYTDLLPKPSIIEAVEAAEWVPYTDHGTLRSKATIQPSNVRTVYKCFCELSEIVHHTLYAMFTPEQEVTTKVVLSLYTRYLDWYSSIPVALRLGQNFTPAVLFVQYVASLCQPHPLTAQIVIHSVTDFK
jgi:hypothetical protein